MSSGGREDESGYALFDFDGTLTRHDTFLPFLIRVGGHGLFQRRFGVPFDIAHGPASPGESTSSDSWSALRSRACRKPNSVTRGSPMPAGSLIEPFDPR